MLNVGPFPFPALLILIYAFSTTTNSSDSSSVTYIFANGWIQTADLWFQKQLLCRLCYNHCPTLGHLLICATIWNDKLYNVKSNKQLQIIFMVDKLHCFEFFTSLNIKNKRVDFLQNNFMIKPIDAC